MLHEIELLQIYGAVAQSSCNDKKGESPLILASKAGDAEVLQILLMSKMDMNEADNEGNTALHLSLKMSPGSISKQIKTMCLLLKHGARVGQRNKMGLTALHIAASNGNLQALQIFLLEDPYNVNATTETKETPLFFAVKNDHKDCVELLLQYGANSEVLNIRKQRPIDFAKSQDMRFVLTQTNVSFMNRPASSPKKYITILRKDGIISEPYESQPDMVDNESSTERTCPNMKIKLCRYFEAPGGCVRGAKCFYAHGEDELQPTKHDKTLFRFPMAELRRKIFVGGLPPSLDSDSLGKHFEQFGFVEEVNVIVTGTDKLQSRGFGFVTFKHEKSISVAVQAHYVTIMGKQVEIKSAVPKRLLSPELQESPPPPPKQEQEHITQLTPQASSTKSKNTDDKSHEAMSWAAVLRRGGGSTASLESSARPTTSLKQTEPKWLQTFKNWFPKFLTKVTDRLKKGEWYALSSVKSDFRATCGFELDHASLGYLKLSDFMNSLPDICRMKIVPVGGRGVATHMVLVPKSPSPKNKSVQKTKISDKIVHAKSTDESRTCDSEESCVVSSYKDALFNSNHPISEAPQVKKNASVSIHPRLFQFLEPDPLFHAWPWLQREVDEKMCFQQRHLVLEALAQKQKNSSIFFLRDFDFYENYKESIHQGKCFACSKKQLKWANFPCQHLLWCEECKEHAIRAAGSSDHKCVICNARVLGFVPSHDQVSNDVSRYTVALANNPKNSTSLAERMGSALLSR